MTKDKYLEFTRSQGYTDEQAIEFMDGITDTPSYQGFVLRLAMQDLKIAFKRSIGAFLLSCVEAYEEEENRNPASVDWD